MADGRLGLQSIFDPKPVESGVTVSLPLSEYNRLISNMENYRTAYEMEQGTLAARLQYLTEMVEIAKHADHLTVAAKLRVRRAERHIEGRRPTADELEQEQGI